MKALTKAELMLGLLRLDLHGINYSRRVRRPRRQGKKKTTPTLNASGVPRNRFRITQGINRNGCHILGGHTMTETATYVGNRLRYGGEQCPTCKDPGIGMVLEIPAGKLGCEGRWICSRCARKQCGLKDSQNGK